MKHVLTLALLLLGAALCFAADSPDTAQVWHDTTLCVTYKARLAGDYLVIDVTHESPWHTYSMDNELRAKEKLAGKQSLGIDRPTSAKITGGLEVTGPWYQTEPRDLSKPELRWFTWGYEGKTQFAAKVKRANGAAQIQIRGQACTDSTCKNINVSMTLAADAPDTGPAVNLEKLVAVRQ